MNYGVIAPGDHWILIPCGLHHPYADCATELPAQKFQCANEVLTDLPYSAQEDSVYTI